MAIEKPVVTIRDFVDLLPIIADREWTISGGRIRDRDGACPICALANEISSMAIHRIWYRAALTSIDVTFDGGSADESLIVLAADRYSRLLNPKQQALRKRMCEVFGL